MKKIMISIMMLVITSAAFSQTWPSKPVLTVEDYMKKRKSQRTGAWLLLLGGTGVTIGSLASAEFLCPFCDAKPFPTIPVSIGVAMVAGSITLFNMAGNNKRKAMRLSFKNERTLVHQNSNTSTPSLAFTLHF